MYYGSDWPLFWARATVAHPLIAKGVPLLPVEKESFFKAMLVEKLFMATNVTPPSSIWALVFDPNMGARDIVASLRHRLGGIRSLQAFRRTPPDSGIHCVASQGRKSGQAHADPAR